MIKFNARSNSLRTILVCVNTPNFEVLASKFVSRKLL